MLQCSISFYYNYLEFLVTYESYVGTNSQYMFEKCDFSLNL